MRLMNIKYRDENDVNRLKMYFDLLHIKHVIYKDAEFTDGTSLYNIFIDRSGRTWEQIMREINYVHPVKMRYVSGMEIREGRLYG